MRATSERRQRAGWGWNFGTCCTVRWVCCGTRYCERTRYGGVSLHVYSFV